jgi:hypothetical protein
MLDEGLSPGANAIVCGTISSRQRAAETTWRPWAGRICTIGTPLRTTSTSWGEVAGALGSAAHREMQWHAIVGSYDFDQQA